MCEGAPSEVILGRGEEREKGTMDRREEREQQSRGQERKGKIVTRGEKMRKEREEKDG